jgi:hypothetical protein
MRKFLVLAVAALTLLCGVAVPVAARGRATPYCGIGWGSLPKEAAPYTSARLTNLRAGRHECFDRLVIDLGPRQPGLPGPDSAGYQVGYVSQFTSDAVGEAIALAGAADLSIVVHASAVDDDGSPTYQPANAASAVNVAGFATFRQVVLDGTFEGQTQIGLGVRARLPFRVFGVAGPGAGSRLVIDVAHRW